MAMTPGLLSDEEAKVFRHRLANLDEWELRVLGSFLWLEKYDHDTSDLAGLPTLLDSLAPTTLEHPDDEDDDY